MVKFDRKKSEKIKNGVTPVQKINRQAKFSVSHIYNIGTIFLKWFSRHASMTR